MGHRYHRFHATASVLAITASAVWGTPAMAQSGDTTTPIEEVVVTGTSIRVDDGQHSR